MGLFDYFKAKPVEVKKPFKRSYAAANTGRLFADFNASEASADAELQGALTKIRNRSRDLARNNEYAKRYLSLLKNNVVGDRGFTLQVKAQDTGGQLDMMGNQEIEDAFKAWGRRCTVDGRLSWNDAQKLCIESLARDGEAFLIKHRGGSFKDAFAIEFIEPDQVDEDLNQIAKNGNQIRMGVEVDQYKRPVAYYIKARHPGDINYLTISTSQNHTRIAADKVIHIYLTLRAGQTRGEPWMAPAISALKQLAGFREAAIINARLGASKMGFFTSPAGDGFVGDDLDGQVPIMDAEPGTFHQLPQGVELSTFDTQFPSNEFDAFHKAALKGVASGLNMSYTSLSNDLEATSYSSIRQGALEERDMYRGLQCFFAEHFIRPVYEDWLSSAMEFGTLILPLRKFDKFATASEFRGRAWSWVDPQKEMTAAVMGMKNGILSLQDVAAQYGKDTEELLAQINKDKALMEQFGITYALEPYGAMFMPVTPDGVEPDTE